VRLAAHGGSAQQSLKSSFGDKGSTSSGLISLPLLPSYRKPE